MGVVDHRTRPPAAERPSARDTPAAPPAPLASPLQTEPWARCQQSLGKETRWLSGDGWTALCVVERRRVGAYLYCPYGPVCETPYALAEALAAIHREARRLRCWWARVEPMPALVEFGCDAERSAWVGGLGEDGWARALRDHQPARTRLVDLARPEAAILADMTGSNRTIHRNHATYGLEIRRSRDPDEVGVLAGFLAEAAAQRGIVLPTAAYLRTVAGALMPSGAATLYTTLSGDEPLCAALVLDSPGQRLFAHAATPARHRKRRPNQPLIVAAMLDAARAGRRYADLFGVAPPEEPDHPWAGFSAFKRSFGGHDVEHLGTWERGILPGVLRAQRARAGSVPRPARS